MSDGNMTAFKNGVMAACSYYSIPFYKCFLTDITNDMFANADIAYNEGMKTVGRYVDYLNGIVSESEYNNCD